MRKLFLAVLGLALALTACQKDETPLPNAATSQTISVTIPQTGVPTRAAGDGTQINRCILEIYHNGELYDKKVASVTESKATFSNLRLVASQTYDFVFWADCAEGEADKYYNTEKGLTAIKVKKQYVGNDDGFDAFFFCEKGYKVTAAFTLNVTLHRPFGQLNVETTDLGKILDTDLKPTDVTVNFQAVPTTFNALTGVASDEAPLEYTAQVIDAASGKLTVDYIWAPDEEGATLSDFSMKFLRSGIEITTNDKFKNIPIRRNYRTNVSGNLLTKQGTINVAVNSQFNNPDIAASITEVENIDDVQQALEGGATNVVVLNAPTAAATISLPSFAEADKTVSISLPATEKQITVKYKEEQTTNPAPAVVNISIPTSDNLVINLPHSTVTLNGQAYKTVEATTAQNTLIVPEGVTINTLNVKQGNVEIYGTVKSITFAEGAGIVKAYAVGDAETLKSVAQLVADGKCAKIVLTADIDLQGTDNNRWTPINAENDVFTEFDGGKHTIRNLYVDNYTGQTDGEGTYYGGLFYVLRGTVKDLTIDGANVTCFRGGALAGRMDYGVVENCQIKNVTVKGVQKVAGLIGYVDASVNKDLTVRGCSVDNCTLKTALPEKGLYQAGGLIGYLQSFERNVLIEGNSVSGISFDKVYVSADTVVDKVKDMEQCYSHAFIGTIANFSKNENAYDNYTIELRNNIVAQQASGIPTCDRTDDYIGWWAGYYNSSASYTPKVIVNGKTKDRWIEVKRLVAQIAAGGEITIRRNYDLSALDGIIKITRPTVITLKKGIVLSSDKEASQLLNESELTIKAGENAQVNMVRRFVQNHGTLTIEGGSYTTQKIGSGTLFWNDDPEAVMTLRNVNVVASNFAVAGGGEIHIEGGYIRSTSTNLNGPNTWAYCVRAQDGGQMTIKNATIEGIQGAIACNTGAHVLIENVKALAKKTPNQSQNDAFYALYAAQTGVIEVISGEFYSDRTPCCLASDEDQPGTPNGGFILKGGKYSSKPHTNIPSMKEWSPAEGCVYAETGDATYPWEIVSQQ